MDDKITLRGGFIPYLFISCHPRNINLRNNEKNFTNLNNFRGFQCDNIRTVFSATTFAQDFTVSPSPVSVDGDVSTTLIEAPSKVINNTDGVLNLRWERVVEDIPAEWQTPNGKP